nr:ATP-binding protein [Xylophilus sp. ASV27]
MNSQTLPPTDPASRIESPSRPAATLHLVFGPQGSGKSTHANTLAKQINGVCFAIDPWMLDLYGPDMSPPLDFSWVMQRVRRCEARIWKTAVTVARQGMDVVLDIGCMKAADRLRFSQMAAQAALPFQTHFVSTDLQTRRQRVQSRNAERGDTFAFPVSPAMFEMMESQYEAPDEAEMAHANVLKT